MELAKFKRIKALVLFSGGLDSILAVKILEEQGVKITALFLKSYFFDEKLAKKTAEILKIPFKTLDISKEQLTLVKKPKYGYGRGMNPCLDCRILMLKKAKELMEKENYSFLATGEVLGERPMSQTKKALKIINDEFGASDWLLRPLSAKVLEETLAEKKGWVKRERLYGIAGRSRKVQISLAKKFKIKNFPNPTGGCLLTDAYFAKKLRREININPFLGKNDIELLKIGRHFWLNSAKIIIGRNKQENEKIKKLKKKNDILATIKNYPAPAALIRSFKKGRIDDKTLSETKELIKKYSSKAEDKEDCEFVIAK
ncbi:MAG: tRNA 4-thiouridine(8) synthase ThiI [Candidatus Paceibacterota bacterium]|jgi:tRNA U34 2-thiouridine synthase MnmA/TrmU|nr:tRNA 4-thiouridine(8) synthase ThiI [Candidatus Paceibacterota bacterium]